MVYHWKVSDNIGVLYIVKKSLEKGYLIGIFSKKKQWLKLLTSKAWN